MNENKTKRKNKRRLTVGLVQRVGLHILIGVPDQHRIEDFGPQDGETADDDDQNDHRFARPEAQIRRRNVHFPVDSHSLVHRFRGYKNGETPSELFSHFC